MKIKLPFLFSSAIIFSVCFSGEIFADTNNPSVGDLITIGTFEQDGSDFNGKEELQWIVLDEATDHSYLVLSLNAITNRAYNEESVDSSWETSSIRQWLNNEFIQETFTPEEIAQIATTHLAAGTNPKYGTPCGNDTDDQIFLLGVNDFKQYIEDTDYQIAYTTQAVINNPKDAAIKDNGATQWWLRTTGDELTNASCVNSNGELSQCGTTVIYHNCIRPAMIINYPVTTDDVAATDEATTNNTADTNDSVDAKNPSKSNIIDTRAFFSNLLNSTENTSNNESDMPAIESSNVSESSEFWNCENCNSENLTTNFCPNCGNPRPVPATWNCDGCGTTDLESVFCPNCGSKRPY